MSSLDRPESDHRRDLPLICRSRAPLQIVRKNEDKTATAEDNGVNQRDRPTAARLATLSGPIRELKPSAWIR